jgi:uncharacterized protein (DUF4415 family)
MQKDAIDPDDAPPLTGEELKRPDVKWRIGGKQVSPEEGKAAFRAALHGKTRTNIHFDNDVIAYYKAKAGPRGYQTLINAALRRDMERTELKVELLQAMKDEFVEPMKAELLNAIEERIGKQPGFAPNTSGLAGATANVPGLSAFYIAGTMATYRLWTTELALGLDDQQEQVVTKGKSNAQIILGSSTPTQGSA